MTGKELQAIRISLGFPTSASAAVFAAALGIKGNVMTRAANIRRLECMDTVPQWYANLATIYLRNPRIMRGMIQEMEDVK